MPNITINTDTLKASVCLKAGDVVRDVLECQTDLAEFYQEDFRNDPTIMSMISDHASEVSMESEEGVTVTLDLTEAVTQEVWARLESVADKAEDLANAVEKATDETGAEDAVSDNTALLDNRETTLAALTPPRNKQAEA